MLNARLFFVAMPFVALLSCSGKGDNVSPAITEPPVTKEYTFENTPYWADEFNGTGIDATKWGYDTGAGGWGNHELEYYTNGANSSIVNGNLVITASKQSYQGAGYTSARMVSKGDGNFLYGRIEVRAKIPGGKGTWPAIWMLPTDNAYGDWPKSGEIDIMEHVGQDPNNIYVTVHTGAYNHSINTQKGITYTTNTATSDYHIYRLDWTPAGINEYIDGQLQFTFKNEGTGFMAWPFDKRFHMMLNIAVGGDWGGAQGVDDTSFPAIMQVDYVRYYRVNNL
ncbi:glycoside hydrolase family 16 protein [Mucilaginibacter ginkgonis]|uniref:Glycoside hydrolase family 16 protein n=1 Tax=Mucilaginibacter ginkgonis TaxID=2682091 RepID=A0A6I4I4L8_9SPHI|nr:glycoside hydrolase family 16 protein [Mucilaginibacter ginkgonis]QQL48956.1 glycoside hydrolase family 16 protein [Mucilaginibacter ginkgonis]